MIVRNEEALLGDLLTAVDPFVDEMIIVDTGSTDGTREIARSFGRATVLEFTHETHPLAFFVDDERTGAPPPYTNRPTLGDFGAARNFGLDHATGQYVLWLDADDILEGAEHLPRIVSDMAAANIETAWIRYLYGFDPGGRCICRLWRERIVKRGTARWVNPIHEIMQPQNPASQMRVQDVNVRHRRPPERHDAVPRRNFKVLVQQLTRTPGDARTLFYYANEAQHFDKDAAVKAYSRYVGLSGWGEERAIARCSMGHIYEERGQVAEAYANYAAARADAPHMPDGAFGLARLAFHRNDWVDCVRFTEEGLKIGDTETVIMVNPLARTFLPLVYYSVALNNLGRVKEALEMTERAIAIMPEERSFHVNAESQRRYLDERACITPAARAAVAFALGAHDVAAPPAELGADMLERMSLQIWKELVRVGEFERAAQLLGALPPAVIDAPSVAAARARTEAIGLEGLSVEIPDDAQRVARMLAARGAPTHVKTIMCIGSDSLRGVTYPGARVSHYYECDDWERERADVVVVSGYLEDVANPVLMLAKAWECVRFGGQLIVMAGAAVPGATWDEPRAGRRRYTAASLTAALRAAKFHVDDAFIEDGVVMARARPMPPRKLLDVVIWTGPAVEPWTPRSPAGSGIGGSETACVEMARHLARMGHAVTVYSDCADGEGVYDGVEYRRHQRWGGATCDVFIASRNPTAVDQVVAKVKLLWAHDVHCGQPGPDMHRWLLKFDRVLSLTKWHKAYMRMVYPHVHEDQFVVTRNGIDPARFAGETEIAFAGEAEAAYPDIAVVERFPVKANRMVYSSSANRGLDVMLDMMPAIRAEVPDAELHVFYGFESWEATARITGNAAELAQIEAFKKRLQTTPGVAWHGRVDQGTLAREMMAAKLWTYPTAFSETYCISALEAQAAGCVPVTTSYAGVAETALWGLRVSVFVPADGHSPPNNRAPGYQREFVAAVVDLLRDDRKREAIAAAGRKWARTQSWEALAVEWSAMFGTLIDELAADPVPRYVGMIKHPEAA